MHSSLTECRGYRENRLRACWLWQALVVRPPISSISLILSASLASGMGILNIVGFVDFSGFAPKQSFPRFVSIADGI